VQKKQAILALQILRFQRRKKVGPSEQYTAFFITKRLQLRFKKNAAVAAEPNRLLVCWSLWLVAGVFTLMCLWWCFASFGQLQG